MSLLHPFRFDRRDGVQVAGASRLFRRRRPRRRGAFALAAALLVVPAAATLVRAAAVAPPAAVDEAPRAEVNRPHELRFDVPGAKGDVDARAVVTGPSGRTTTVGAFPLAEGWAVRVRPRAPGVHAYRILVREGKRERELASGRFVAAATGAPGQVVVRGAALETEDGAPFVPLGENRMNVYDPAWSDGLSPEDYVARMAREGMNTIRVFMFVGCRAGDPKRPACLEPERGRFDPAAAAIFDRILDAAERDGVKVILAPFAIGFTPGDAWKGWESNPWSAARGGPARTPAEFFTRADAREGAKRRLRYVADRWAASPALLAVDLLNEPEWDGPVDEKVWIPWAEDLARTWREADPYGHPVTLGSVGLHWNVSRDERPWWASPLCDVVQWHRYGPDVYDVHALAAALVATVRDTRRYGKPVLLGEFAYGGEAKPAYDHTHVGIWATTFAGAGVLAHSAPPFSIDSDEPMTAERARHFRVLADFLAGAEVAAGGALAPAADPAVSWPPAPPPPRAIPETARAELAPGAPRPAAAAPVGPGAPVALALGRGATRALWLMAPRALYAATVRGARVALPDLPPGPYRVRWRDDVTGAPLGDEVATLGGDAAVTAPPFAEHVAALVTPVAGGATPGARR